MDCNITTPEKQDTDDRQIEKYSLLESLDKEWIKFPFTIMQDVGPAVQSLGGLLKITMKETFSSVETIAQHTRLPISTIRKHLATLHEHGWIENKGREHTRRRGALRRTATISITRQTKDHVEPYGVLPWWACCNIRKVGKLPWSAKALLSVLMARLCSLKGAAERDGPDDDPAGQIENMGGDDRFRFSLTYLTRQTGLTRDSIVTAKKRLHKHKIICWSGRENVVDILSPNWDFAVIVTPATPEHIWLDFGHREG